MLDLLDVRDRAQTVSSLLELVCEGIQLTPAQHADATGRYVGIGRWLGQSGSSLEEYSPDIYPQGSMALETTVRPRGRVEFDLDIICVIHHPDGLDVDPGHLHEIVRQRVADNSTYERLLDSHEKCIRLSYANDFHLDIVPALADPIRAGTAIVVPQKRGDQWVMLNNDPKRYRRWFDQVSVELARSYAASMEPLPEHSPAYRKNCLRRTTQLLKRRRDVFFNGNSYAPSSIVLTTLVGEEFCGGNSCAQALAVALIGILKRIEGEGGKLTVRNPLDANENFTAGWTHDQHRKFSEFIEDFSERVQKLFLKEGLYEVGKALAELFDTPQDAVSKRALGAFEERITGGRSARRIGVTSAGIIAPVVASVASVRQNTFYGKEDIS